VVRWGGQRKYLFEYDFHRIILYVPGSPNGFSLP
jgi:hypothetical protein